MNHVGLLFQSFPSCRSEPVQLSKSGYTSSCCFLFHVYLPLAFSLHFAYVLICPSLEMSSSDAVFLVFNVIRMFTIFPTSSSFVSFTQFSPTFGRMLLPALSLWPGRQPCRPRLVDGRRGGGPSSVAPHSRNPPTGRHRDSPISSSLFSHGPLLCAVG